ncbi:hypothetical protein J7J45_00835 [Candidatus Aerophobetes bacterium]|nr:hypothetical protein [Candidatus Aerophobetes bacterium]
MKNYIAGLFIASVIIIGMSSSVFGQNESNLIDTPTAKLLEKGSYYLNFRFYQEGGLLIQGKAGLTDRLTVGASYGGTGVVGVETVKGNPEPAFSIKYKFGKEGENNLPFDLSLGYEGQGYGKYYKEGDEIIIDGHPKKLTKSFYQINSMGFYLVLTKKVEKSNLTINGGLNCSLEDDPGKAGISPFIGVQFRVTPKLIVKLEYNNASHKKTKYKDIVEGYSGDKILRKAGGEINIGFKFLYSKDLSLELAFKDLSHRYASSGNRIFQIAYTGEF